MATLAGQTIVALGGTSGVGFSVAKGALLSLAAHVIVASSTQAKVDNAVEKLRALISEKSLPGKVTGYVLDTLDFQAVGTFFEEIGEINHLVFTSGGRGIIPGFKGLELETLRPMISNCLVPANAVQKANIKPGGSITLTQSQVVNRPMPNFAIISGISGAIDCMTRGFALDLAPIRVNVVSLGLVHTEFWNNTPPAVLEQILEKGKNVPVKHVGTADEVAEAYLFAMKCTYMTGQRIEVDGGAKLI